jgi:hypothetical protein
LFEVVGEARIRRFVVFFPQLSSLDFGDGGKSCDRAVVSHARVAFATVAICEGETKGCEVAEGECQSL